MLFRSGIGAAHFDRRRAESQARTLVRSLSGARPCQPAIAAAVQADPSIPGAMTTADLPAMRSALRALGQGRILGVFPEGKIETTQQLLPFQTGVALMASRTGVPIFPAYVEGTQRNLSMKRAYLFRQEAVLAFGHPIHLAGRPDLELATSRIQQAVENLRLFVTTRDPGYNGR